MVVVTIWLQHKFLGVHFPVIQVLLNFFNLPFSIRVLSIVSFKFLFLLKALIGSSSNSYHRFLFVLGMFQFSPMITTKFRKNRLYDSAN